MVSSNNNKKKTLASSSSTPFVIVVVIFIHFTLNLSQLPSFLDLLSASTEPKKNTAINNVNLTSINSTDYTGKDSWPSCNISSETLVYHIGWSPRFGQTNNQLIAILHALDMAFDTSGEWDGSMKTTNTVVAVSGWAKEVLGLFLSADQSNPDMDSNWTFPLEQNLPIVDYQRVGIREVVKVGAGDAFYYSRDNKDLISPSLLKIRRKLILEKLLSMLPNNRFERYNMLQTHLKERGLGENYAAIHLRSLDGQCVQRVGSKLSPEECDMEPTYIKRLLRPRYTNLSQVPIVVISDMQRKQPLQKLVSDPEIGGNVIVTSWNFPPAPTATAIVQDMMIAAKGDFFLGPRVSSMTVMIGIMRVAMGARPQTNLVYVREKRPLFSDSSFEVCEDCIFYCNGQENDICGKSPVYA